MLIKNYVINELTILLAEKTQIPAKEIQNILSKFLYNYDIVEIKTTLPSTNNGEATKYLFKKFAEAKISIGMKQKTLYQYKLAVEKICKTEKMDLNLLTSENIIHFINTMRREGLAPGTIKHKYLLLSSIFSFLYNHRYISYNPMVETDTPKGIQKEKKPLTQKEIESIKLTCEKSGVTRIHPHLLRATFATNLAIKGVSIEIIAKLLGHANLHTVDRYILMNDEKIKNTIQKIM